jgi:hypothetical protein
MKILREIREVESEELVIQLPGEFKKKKIEVIIRTIDNNEEYSFSEAVNDFLRLGGSGIWEGSLEEMRELRDAAEKRTSVSKWPRDYFSLFGSLGDGDLEEPAEKGELP